VQATEGLVTVVYGDHVKQNLRSADLPLLHPWPGIELNPTISISTMATIKTILRLSTLDLNSIPAVVQATNCSEINAAVDRLYRQRQATDPVGHCFTPCEIVKAVWWWWRQPFSEAQLQKFLDTEGNFAEEYLESGSFSATEVRLKSQLATINNTTTCVHSQKDRRGGQIVLLNEPLEVREHRRVHKRHREHFATCILAAVKCKFAVPKRTEANFRAIHRYAGELIKQKGVRPVDAARITPYVVHAAFIPSDDEVNAARWLTTTLARERIAGWEHMPSA